MNIPEELYYTRTHEWARKENGNLRVGITDYAQQEITEVVHVELPSLGLKVKKGDAIAVVESVKAAFDIYAPASGEVIEINEALTDHPEWVNEDPYGRGYFLVMKMLDEAELKTLLDAEGYKEALKE